MFIKFIVLSLIYVTISLMVNRSECATTQDSKQSPDQMLERFLLSLTKQSTQNTNNSPKVPNYSQYYSTEAPVVRQPPVPAPPMGGPISFEAPVAWPYPPAPKSSGGGSEFPLLERFLSSNGVTNYRSNYQPQTLNPTPIQPINTPWKPIITSTPVPYVMPQPIRPMPSVMPPPLQSTNNWDINHNGRNGQPRHYNLDTVRLNDGQNENFDKLNVSLTMAQHVRPLSLNFDSGEIVVDFGQNSGKTEQVSNYKSKIPDFGEIYSSQTNGNKEKTRENDDEYIVLRHDVNKYAYDMPKDGGSDGRGSGNSNTGAAQPSKVDRYSVPANKDNHFVLGRVSN